MGNRWHSNLFAFRSVCAQGWRGSISRKTPCTRSSRNRTDCGWRTVSRRFPRKLRRQNSGSCWLSPKTPPCSSSIEKPLPKMAGPSNSRDRRIAVINTAPLCARSERRGSEEHTSELQSRFDLVCRLLLEKKKKKTNYHTLDSPLTLLY